MSEQMSEMKTHWKKQFNYDYMGSYSLPDGRDVTLTIKETKRETVIGLNGKKEECFVCYFNESNKPMILNRTNCKSIAKVVGTPFIEEWLGKRVQIGIDIVNAFGEQTEALRIRNVKPRDTKDYTQTAEQLRSCTTIESLQATYLALSAEEKTATVAIKDEMKLKLSAK